MSFRFFRRIRIAPGIRLNLSGSGISASVGRRGAWYTIGANGRRQVTLGIPGTGLRFSERTPVESKSQAAAAPEPTPPQAPKPVAITPEEKGAVKAPTARWLLVLLVLAIVGFIVVHSAR